MVFAAPEKEYIRTPSLYRGGRSLSREGKKRKRKQMQKVCKFFRERDIASCPISGYNERYEKRKIM